jgi:hypothetical protein
LFVVTGASAVTAGYPGSMCAINFSAAMPFHDGVIARNQSSSQATFICNAVQLGAEISSARVGVRDLNPSDEIICFARASGEFDTSGFVTPSVGSGVGFTGTVSLALGSTANFVTNGSKNVVCRMPGKLFIEGSAVASYKIVEN